MRMFWKIAKWFVVAWIVFVIFAFSLHIWTSCKQSAYTMEKIDMMKYAKILFFEYWDKGTLPLKANDFEGGDDSLNKVESERFTYKIIDAKSNIFSVSSKKIEMTMFFKIDGTTNKPILTKIEGENLIQIRDFYSNKEGAEEDKLAQNRH